MTTSCLTTLDPTECYTDSQKGRDYRGRVSQTTSGKTCQRWTTQEPHSHSYTPAQHPNKGLGEHNFCRNPDGRSKPWCYTTDSGTKWGYCDVGLPSRMCGT